jgi:uncharacterized protein YceK
MTIIKIVGRLNYIPDKKALLISFLITLSGCASVMSNSERFYQDHPRGRINWREYMTD